MDETFANAVYNAFPSYQEAKRLGSEFVAVNEKLKVQIPEYKKFPSPILQLHQILASRDFISKVEAMIGIPNLLADPELTGCGMHETN